MNCYMVVLRCSCDDIPLLVTPLADEAEEFAKRVGWTDGEREKILLSIDATPNCVSIYQFIDGRLMGVVLAKEF